MTGKFCTVVASLACLTTSVVRADIFEPDLPGGSMYHLVFLSDSKNWAGPGELSFYDGIVTSDAAADSDLATLTWKIVGSTTVTSAKTHTDIQGAVYRIDGRLIANDEDDFWDGSIANPINVTAGGDTNVSADVWTGSSTAGAEAACGTTDGTTPCSLGRGDFANETVYGSSSATNGDWIRGGEEDLFSDLRYYAISEPILIEVLYEPCDINQDGVCDANDIDAMSQMVIDGTKTAEERLALIESPMTDGFNTYVGDSDLNGVFDDQDIVKVFITGKYLTEEAAVWEDGDWDGNQKFDDQDFVAAFIAGGYLLPPRSAVSAVPEPAGLALMAVGLLALVRYRR